MTPTSVPARFSNASPRRATTAPPDQWTSTALGEHGLTDSQCVALAILREEEALDNRAYRTATGVDSRVATAELQDLVARELVTQTGTRRWALATATWGT